MALRQFRNSPLQIPQSDWLRYRKILQHSTKPTKLGRPRIKDKYVFEAIIYKSLSGVSWRHLEAYGYPPGQTVYDRFNEWINLGAFGHFEKNQIQIAFWNPKVGGKGWTLIDRQFEQRLRARPERLDFK
jgi:hypothetical protein